MAKKCVICGKPIDKEEETNCVPYKNRLAHPDCFNFAMKTIKDNKDEQLEKQKKKKETQSKISGRGRKASVKTPKAELKDTVSDEEYREKKQYYDYLHNLLGVDKLSAKVYTVSERDKERFGWTWDGMYNTLVYLNEIKEKTIAGDIVGLIPYYYDESEKFYEEVKRIKENNKEVSLSNMYQTKKIVYHKRPQKIEEDLVIESIQKA